MKTILNGIEIKAISSWLPTNVLEMSSLNDIYGEKEVANIIKATGIERVRVADTDMTSSDMCYNAALHLIDQENIDCSEIDGLVFVSQTTDYILPATSVILQDRLKLNKGTVCIDIHYGCSGYIYGLFQAAMWINCGACKNVLVLAGDTSSRIINPLDKSIKMVFGDCGTATLVSKGDCKMGFSINSDGSGYDKLIIPAGGFRYPSDENTSIVTYDEDNNGRSKNDLYMDGSAIFNFAITEVHKDVNNIIGLMEWDKSEIDLYALHQANNFMVNYVRKKLKVSPDLVPLGVKNYGNTGPATIPLLLSDIYSNRSDSNLEKVILSGFGVGLSWGSVATNLSKTKLYSPVNK
ncbi:MAG: ketoacyl-ACP synthase III [Rikenellaceae bacterium]